MDGVVKGVGDGRPQGRVLDKGVKGLGRRVCLHMDGDGNALEADRFWAAPSPPMDRIVHIRLELQGQALQLNVARDRVGVDPRCETGPKR